jgi:lipoprotein
MKNIKKLILLALLFIPLLTACGNKDILGMTYTFKYATVKLPDGTLIDGEVKEWARSSDTDSVRVTFVGDKGEYLTHFSNVVLYNK